MWSMEFGDGKNNFLNKTKGKGPVLFFQVDNIESYPYSTIPSPFHDNFTGYLY